MSGRRSLHVIGSEKRIWSNLLQHCSSETEIDPDKINDQSQHQGMPCSNDPGVSQTRMPAGHTLDGRRPSQGVGASRPTRDDTHTKSRQIYLHTLKRLKKESYVHRFNDSVRLFMRDGEPDPTATGRFPERLAQPLQEILDLLNGGAIEVDGQKYGLTTDPPDGCLYRLLGGVIKHARGVQTSNSLLFSMLKRDYLRSEENDAG